MRAKSLALTITALAGAVVLGAGSQPWVVFELEGGGAEESTGHALNAALSPIALAIIAAALALSIAGPIFRRVLGVIVAALGVGASLLTWAVLSDPVAATATRVTELTGLAGHAGQAAVTSETVTAWPWASLAAAIISALAGIMIVVTSGRWASGGRKYDATVPKDAAAKHDRISDWDSLSDGQDPTDEAEEIETREESGPTSSAS